MTPNFSYESDLYKNLPENSGYLTIYISESRCDIAICSSSLVLVFFKSYVKDTEMVFTDFLKDLFSNHQSLFARHFEAVNVGFHNQSFTILPSAMNIDAAEAIQFLTKNQEDEVAKIPLDFLESQFVYQIPNEMSQLVAQSFEKPMITHSTKVSLDIAKQTKADILLLIGEHYFDIVTKKGEMPQSINRFEMESEEDVLYFSLLALKDAEINPQDAKVTITGYCPPNGDLHQKLLEFIGQVEVGKINNSVTIPPDFPKPANYAEAVINLLNANY